MVHRNESFAISSAVTLAPRDCLMYKPVLTYINGRYSSWTQDLNWTYVRHSKDLMEVSWTSFVPSTYFLCPGGYERITLLIHSDIQSYHSEMKSVLTNDDFLVGFLDSFDHFHPNFSLHWLDVKASSKIILIRVQNCYSQRSCCTNWILPQPIIKQCL